MCKSVRKWDIHYLFNILQHVCLLAKSDFDTLKNEASKVGLRVSKRRITVLKKDYHLIYSFFLPSGPEDLAVVEPVFLQEHELFDHLAKSKMIPYNQCSKAFVIITANV